MTEPLAFVAVEALENWNGFTGENDEIAWPWESYAANSVAGRLSDALECLRRWRRTTKAALTMTSATTPAMMPTMAPVLMAESVRTESAERHRDRRE